MSSRSVSGGGVRIGAVKTRVRRVRRRRVGARRGMCILFFSRERVDIGLCFGRWGGSGGDGCIRLGSWGREEC